MVLSQLLLYNISYLNSLNVFVYNYVYLYMIDDRYTVKGHTYNRTCDHTHTSTHAIIRLGLN